MTNKYKELEQIAKNVLSMDFEEPCTVCSASPCANGEKLNSNNCPLKKLTDFINDIKLAG